MSKRWRKPLTMVLVGCGRIAHSYATIIDSHLDMELEAVVDINPEAAYTFGNSFRCSHYSSLDSYLNNQKYADCAVICTPPSSHTEIATLLLQRGINVLCEKPFALDYTSASQMVGIARDFDLNIMMGSKYRYVADIIHARGLIQAGILGDILTFEFEFCDIVDMRGRWNVQPQFSGGGVLIDNGSHAVDITRFLFGPISGICAEEARRIQSELVEDTVCLGLRTVSGIKGTAQLSWTIKNASDDYIRVYGTQGTLCIGWKKSQYRPNGARDWISFGEGYSKLKALTRQMVNFVEVITENEIPEVTATDSLESVRVIEAAYKSLPNGQWIDLSPSAKAISTVITERKLALLRPAKNSDKKKNQALIVS
jgi:predicted dehydrogenase